MSIVNIPTFAKKVLQIKRFIRNSKSPQAELQNLLAENAGYAAFIRAKPVFRAMGPIWSGTASVIPTSQVDTRTRWRCAFHSGPFTQYLWGRFYMARQNSGAASDTIGRVILRDGTGTIVGQKSIHFGSNGTAGIVDSPGSYGTQGFSISDPDEAAILEVLPETDYYLEFQDVTRGRLIAAEIHEFALAPDTDNGYVGLTVAGGTSILDKDRADIVSMMRRIWKRHAGQQWNWTTDQDSEVRSMASATYKNIIDDSTTTVSATTPGVKLDMRNRTTLNRTTTGVPIRFKVYGASTNGSGSVRIVDSAGSTVIDCPITATSATWHTVDGDIPATDAKYDLHYGGTTGTLTAYASSLYEYDAEGDPVYGALNATLEGVTLVATGTVASSDDLSATFTALDTDYWEGDDSPWEILVNVVGGTHTNVVITLTVPRENGGNNGATTYSAVEATIEANVGTENSGWTIDYSNTASEHIITFTDASLAAGAHTINVAAFYDAATGPIFLFDEGTHGITVDCQSDQDATGTGDTANIVVGATPVIAVNVLPTDLTVSSPTPIGWWAVVDVTGQNQTSLTLVQTVAYYGGATDAGAPTTSNLNGWTQSVAWNESPADTWNASFTLASASAGSQTLPSFTAPSGTTNGLIDVTATVDSAEAESGQDVETFTISAFSEDATSGIAVPADSTEWAAFIAAHSLSIAVPDSLWLCQEASGNLSDSIGSLTLTAANTPQYSQTASGWTRLGVGMTDGSTMRFVAAGGVGPDPTTTSSLWLYLTVLRSEPTTTRVFGGATRCDQSSDCVRLVFSPSAGTNRLNVNCDGVGGTGSADHTATTHPFVLKYDRTNSVCATFSEIEKVTTTYSGAVVDGNKGIGANTTPDMVFVYAAMWSGGDAEVTNTNIKALLTALGFAPSWTP